MSVDWNKVWENHADGYKNGIAHIPLPNGAILKLKPGGGFGDHSHPTTKLSLKLLANHVQEKVVVDVGSGSGILSIAASLLGAKAVYALEICAEAIQHTRENIAFSKCKNIFINTIPTQHDITVINMISSEQRKAFTDTPSLRTSPSLLISSGLLSSEKETYLSYLDYPQVLSEEYLDGWMALTLLN